MDKTKGEKGENSCRSQIGTAVLPLFFYVYWNRPELHLVITIGLFSFWAIALFLDMRITASLKDLVKKHKANDIFRILYQKFGKKAVPIQLGIETAFVILFPSIMTLRQPGESFEINVTGAAILGGIIGVLHIFAWHSNKKEIQKIIEASSETTNS